jgi:hypothetical protein
MARRDRRYVAKLADAVHAVVIQITARIPQQIPVLRDHHVRLVTDPDGGLHRESEQVRLDLTQPRSVSSGGQFLQRRPLLPRRRHVLALVGADGAHPDRLGVFDAARPASPPRGIFVPHHTVSFATHSPSKQRRAAFCPDRPAASRSPGV